MGKRKGLTPLQKSKLEQLTEQLPVDAVPGFTVITSPAVKPGSIWVNRMSRYSEDLGSNAYAYFNYNFHKTDGLKKRSRKPRRIISAEGFPPDISVTYAYPPPYAFMTPFKLRDIKHFVFHSMGHAWHAIQGPGTKYQWMNNYAKGRGVVPHVRPDGSTIYIAKGSDPQNMANYARFRNGLMACLHSAAQASAHFFIDRDGNLVVVGDCNDVIWTSPGVHFTSLGVELEEAFYVTNDTREKENRAVWRPGGNPPGTAGNIEYFTFSSRQLLTLSILVRKLETMYPHLKERNISFKRRSLLSKDPAGYTMHDWIGGKHNHMDVSPHYLTQDMWDSFFALVDAHHHITKDNCFRPANYETPARLYTSQPTPLSLELLTSMTGRVYNNAKEKVVARDRSRALANASKSTANNTAGKNAVRASKKNSKEVADIVQVAQRTQNPIVELPNNATGPTEDGFPPGHDDMWSYT